MGDDLPFRLKRSAKAGNRSRGLSARTSSPRRSNASA
ncbi:hypothetical protein CGSMWGv1400E_02546 [Gardnerella vaginalis 1400E]|uniref:Uncharacterized protein n=1 Tax=Gardnerella vaginalis 1400E TaxID=698956 RepID=I4LX50_GARVA|nr:hypothetical protein CGSMWGv1400E_02546 [Gardnerella vaginalis 1400E]